ncbi:carbohydrate ABC transporter permease [Robinsoniella peoriensis]|uniref:carbohydrate ABC transporter permease n=1 Tax=Robinsoniella peoriensis TaxID=180332 RepID=UPI000B0998C5|nr:carbohydrate ABC transporter permease [Robinsoniella peoriensis]
MRKKKIGKMVTILILLLISSVYIIPIVMMVFGSFKTQGEALQMNLSLPKQLQFENYKHVIETGGILRGYANSLIITVTAVAVIIIFGAMTGIIISRRDDNKGRGLYYYFVFGLTATMQMVTTYALVLKLHLYGTYFSVILVLAAVNLPFAVMTFSSYVKGIPREIDEAAVMDGCHAFQLIFKILLPIMKPITITNLIIAAIGIWNNFQVPLYLMSSSERTTIPMMIFNFYGLYSRDWNYVFAALVITVLPIVILYLCLQKYIVEGMTSGAVKG